MSKHPIFIQLRKCNTLWFLAAHTKKNPCHHVAQSADIATLLSTRFLSWACTKHIVAWTQRGSLCKHPVLYSTSSENAIICQNFTRVELTELYSAVTSLDIYAQQEKAVLSWRVEFPLHTHAEHCGTMTKYLSWYTKGIFLELVIPFFKAAEVAKALRRAEFRSVLEITRCIIRGFTMDQQCFNREELQWPSKHPWLEIEESDCNTLTNWL